MVDVRNYPLWIIRIGDEVSILWCPAKWTFSYSFSAEMALAGITRISEYNLDMQEIHSAGGVVIGPKGEVLLVCQDGICWSLPKGPLEQSETAMDAAQRKIYEESGIEPEDLNYIKPLGNYQRYRTGPDGNEDPNIHKTIDMFLFQTQVADLNPHAKNIQEARWLPKYEVIKYLTHPKDKDFFTSVLFDLP